MQNSKKIAFMLIAMFITTLAWASSVSVNIEQFGSTVRISVIHSSSAGASKTRTHKELKKFIKEKKISRHEIQMDEAGGKTGGGFLHILQFVILEVGKPFSVQTMAIEPGAKAVAFGSRKFAVLHDSGLVTIIDARKNTILATVQTRANAKDIVFAGKEFAVLNEDGSVDMISSSKNEHVANLPSNAKGFGQGSITSSKSQVCLVGDNGAFKVFKIAKHAVVVDENLNEDLKNAIFVGSNLYAVSKTENAIVKLNTKGEVLKKIQLNAKPVKLAAASRSLVAISERGFHIIKKDAVVKEESVFDATDVVVTNTEVAIASGSTVEIFTLKDTFFPDRVFCNNLPKVITADKRYVGFSAIENSLTIIKKGQREYEAEARINFNESVSDVAFGEKKIVVVGEGTFHIITENK